MNGQLHRTFREKRLKSVDKKSDQLKEVENIAKNETQGFFREANTLKKLFFQTKVEKSFNKTITENQKSLKLIESNKQAFPFFFKTVYKELGKPRKPFVLNTETSNNSTAFNLFTSFPRENQSKFTKFQKVAKKNSKSFRKKEIFIKKSFRCLLKMKNKTKIETTNLKKTPQQSKNVSFLFPSDSSEFVKRNSVQTIDENTKKEQLNQRDALSPNNLEADPKRNLIAQFIETEKVENEDDFQKAKLSKNLNLFKPLKTMKINSSAQKSFRLLTENRLSIGNFKFRKIECFKRKSTKKELTFGECFKYSQILDLSKKEAETNRNKNLIQQLEEQTQTNKTQIDQFLIRNCLLAFEMERITAIAKHLAFFHQNNC